MGEDFQVGDVVVCVDASEICCLTARHSGKRAPQIGEMMRIESIGLADDVDCSCVTLYGAKSGLAVRFRKLPKADEEFTASIRACKPSRNWVPA